MNICLGVYYNKRKNRFFIMWDSYIGPYMECCSGITIDGCDHSFEDMWNRDAEFIGEF